LAKQGMEVEIRVLNETNYDEVRLVRGIGGNGYLFLQGICGVFDTQFKYMPGHVVVISGVGLGKSSLETGRSKDQ
jgi:hypothetical protein